MPRTRWEVVLLRMKVEHAFMAISLFQKLTKSIVMVTSLVTLKAIGVPTKRWLPRKYARTTNSDLTSS